MPAPVTINGLKEHQGTEATALGMPQLMAEHPRVKAWMTEAEADPTRRKRNTMLAFQLFMEMWTQGQIEVEGVEPWANFRQDTRQGLQTILEQTERGETIAAFTSGGTISSITAEALAIQHEPKVAAMNFSIRNTAFTTFLYSRNQFNLLSFNELPHLHGDMVTFV